MSGATRVIVWPVRLATMPLEPSVVLSTMSPAATPFAMNVAVGSVRTVAESGPDAVPLARTIGASVPLARTIGASVPLARTIGASVPLARTIGASVPLARTIVEIVPPARNAPVTEPPETAQIGADGSVATSSPLKQPSPKP